MTRHRGILQAELLGEDGQLGEFQIPESDGLGVGAGGWNRNLSEDGISAYSMCKGKRQFILAGGL